MILNCNGIPLDVTKPKVMAILNLTPDSFYDGNTLADEKAIADRIDNFVNEGADIIDIGAMSSRPGAEIISSTEEIKRLEFAIQYMLSTYLNIPFSVDTIHASVAQYAGDKGCHMINDISGGHYDGEMLEIVSRFNMPFVGMHMKGTPETMASQNQYPNGMLVEMLAYFKELLEKINKYSIQDIIIDPGFGFAKNPVQNFQLLTKMNALSILDKPLLVGISRKSFIYRSLSVGPEKSLNGTSALHMVALQNGANILRVHDVNEAKEVIELFWQLTTQANF